MSEERQKPEIEIGGENRRMVFTLGTLADLEEGGYEPGKIVQDIANGGQTAPLLYLSWLMLREGAAAGQKDITIDDLRRQPPRFRLPLMAACLEAVREGFEMESKDEGTRDPVLEEIEKKDGPDA